MLEGLAPAHSRMHMFIFVPRVQRTGRAHICSCRKWARGSSPGSCKSYWCESTCFSSRALDSVAASAALCTCFRSFISPMDSFEALLAFSSQARHACSLASSSDLKAFIETARHELACFAATLDCFAPSSSAAVSCFVCSRSFLSSCSRWSRFAVSSSVSSARYCDSCIVSAPCSGRGSRASASTRNAHQAAPYDSLPLVGQTHTVKDVTREHSIALCSLMTFRSPCCSATLSSFCERRKSSSRFFCILQMP